METLVQDLRYAVRSLIKNPGFFAIAVLTLALGIGANTAMFTAVNAVLLRPLAYPDAETLVLIEGRNPSKGMTRTSISVPDLVDWQTQNQSFEELAGFVTGDTFPPQVARRVSPTTPAIQSSSTSGRPGASPAAVEMPLIIAAYRAHQQAGLAKCGDRPHRSGGLDQGRPKISQAGSFS